MVSPYYFKSETVRRVNNFELSKTHVPSDAQKLPQNAVTLLNGALSHITLIFRYLLHEMFPNLRIRRYGPTGCPARSQNLAQLKFRLRVGGKLSVLGFCASLRATYMKMMNLNKSVQSKYV